MRLLLLLCAAVSLAGCGYVGDPLPPALKRPLRITDLAAVERGDKIVVQFTLPTTTTEGLPIHRQQDVELRYGAVPAGPFRYEAWEQASERVADVSQDHETARVDLPAGKFVGKDLVIGVRVHGPKGGDDGWSNLVSLPVVPPLPTPQGLAAKDAPSGVQLEWHAPAPKFRVYRRLKGDAAWVEIGVSEKPLFVDAEIVYGKAYEYFVQTIEQTRDAVAESEISATLEFSPKDSFPPVVPSGVTTVPGARSIEVLWDRNVDKDLAGYRVYRDGSRVTETLPSPAYSDKNAKPGTRYSYQVSAIDKAGNESALSPAAEALIP